MGDYVKVQLPSRALVTYKRERGVFVPADAGESAQPPFRFIPVKPLSTDKQNHTVDACVTVEQGPQLGAAEQRPLEALRAVRQWERDHALTGSPPSSPLQRVRQLRYKSITGSLGALRKLAGRTSTEESRAASEQQATEEAAERRKKTRNLMKRAVKEVNANASVNKSAEAHVLSEQKVLKALKAFLTYLAFLMCFCISVFATRSPSDFWTNEATRQLLVNSAFHFEPNVTHEKTFYDIRFIPELHAWLQGRLLEVLFSTELGSAPLALHGYNRILGPVRLRQLRVKAGSCTVPEVFRPVIEGCWAPYSLLDHSSESFGPAEAPQLYRYSSSSQLDDFAYPGLFALYSGGGFVVDLPKAAAEARAALRELEQNRWLDRASRALFVDFAAYNPNVHRLSSARLIFELPASGGIVPSATLRVLRPLTYESRSDSLRLVFELASLGFISVSLVRAVRRVLRQRRAARAAKQAANGGAQKGNGAAKSAGDGMAGMLRGGLEALAKVTRVQRAFSEQKMVQHPYHVLDWVNQALFWTALVLRFYTMAETRKVFKKLRDGDADTYVNLQPLMYMMQQEHNVNAVNCFLLIMKGFKYLSLLPQLNVLFLTIKQARLDLFFFVILFTTVLLGYAVAFHVAFGSDVEGFRTLGLSMLSLIQLLLGIFDYESLHLSSPALAPLLFCSYSVLVIFVLANIFLAIINDAFAVVSEQKNGQQPLFALLKNLFYKKLLGRSPMHKMIEDIRRGSAESNDKDGDNKLDPGELEQMLHTTKLHGHLTVKGLLEEFDVNGDGVLSGGEVERLNQRLLRTKREVDLQLAAQLSPRSRAQVRDTFMAHDPDMSKSLDTAELENAIGALGYDLSPSQLQVLLEEFDYDESGTLDLLEFTAMMARMLGYKEIPNEQLRMLHSIFDFLDIDDDASLAAEQIAVGIDKLGLQLTEPQLRTYIDEFDGDLDGRLNKEEFCSLVAKVQGQQGHTANPRIVSKELQMTVSKLEEVVSANEQRVQQALNALLSEAKATLSEGEHWRAEPPPPLSLCGSRAGSAASAAAAPPLVHGKPAAGAAPREAARAPSRAHSQSRRQLSWAEQPLIVSEAAPWRPWRGASSESSAAAPESSAAAHKGARASSDGSAASATQPGRRRTRGSPALKTSPAKRSPKPSPAGSCDSYGPAASRDSCCYSGCYSPSASLTPASSLTTSLTASATRSRTSSLAPSRASSMSAMSRTASATPASSVTPSVAPAREEGQPSACEGPRGSPPCASWPATRPARRARGLSAESVADSCSDPYSSRFDDYNAYGSADPYEDDGSEGRGAAHSSQRSDLDC